MNFAPGDSRVLPAAFNRQEGFTGGPVLLI
jgi:hypothetical protein